MVTLHDAASLANVARYIREHGFTAWVDAERRKVVCLIPTTRDGKPSGDIVERVSNLREARRALGY